jgi:tripartite-type tricarboxylate transporter receptor subunit TctC
MCASKLANFDIRPDFAPAAVLPLESEIRDWTKFIAEKSIMPEQLRSSIDALGGCPRGTNMILSRRRLLRASAVAAIFPPASRNAAAQTFPTHPITLVVPFPAAGPADVLARILSEPMRAFLGQPVIIDNIAGAAGSIGVGRVARAPPDGYTLILGNLGTHVFNGAIYSLGYDVVNDFEPISLLPSNNQLIIARNAIPAKNLRELVAWVKANSDKVTCGTAGPGSPSHIAAAYFQSMLGVRFQLVPYRGTPQVIQDLVAGQIDLVFDQVSSSLAQVRSGKIKAFAVTAKSRLAAAPEIPSVDEAGLPGFYTTFWFGLWAPKDTPLSIIERLNAAVVKVMADTIVQSRLAELGSEIPTSEQQNPHALAVLQKAEIDRWWPIIRQANIKG